MWYGKDSLLAEEIFIVNIYGSKNEKKLLLKLIRLGKSRKRKLCSLCESIKKRIK